MTEAVDTLEMEKQIDDWQWEQYHALVGEEAVSDAKEWFCPGCLSTQGQWRGYRVRKDRSIAHRRCCKACKKWFFVEC